MAWNTGRLQADRSIGLGTDGLRAHHDVAVVELAVTNCDTQSVVFSVGVQVCISLLVLWSLEITCNSCIGASYTLLSEIFVRLHKSRVSSEFYFLSNSNNLTQIGCSDRPYTLCFRLRIFISQHKTINYYVISHQLYQPSASWITVEVPINVGDNTGYFLVYLLWSTH